MLNTFRDCRTAIATNGQQQEQGKKQFTLEDVRRKLKSIGIIINVERLMKNINASEIPAQYTHSVKIEDTAKVIRLSVHVYANDLESAVNEAIKLY